MGKSEYDNPNTWISGEILQEDLKRLQLELEKRDLLVTSSKVNDDGELSIAPFYAPIAWLFFDYEKQHDAHLYSDNFCAFKNGLESFYQDRLTFSKKKYENRFRGELRGFLTYLTASGRVSRVLQQYYDSEEYLSDYGEIERKNHSFLYPQFKENQTHLDSTELRAELGNYLLDYCTGIQDLGVLYGRVARSQIQMAVYYDKTQTVLKHQLRRRFGKPYIEYAGSDDLNSTEFRFSHRERTVQIWLFHSSIEPDMTRAIEILEKQPEKQIEFDLLLRRHIAISNNNEAVFWAVSDFLRGLTKNK